MDRSLKNNFLSTKSTVFMDGDHSAPNERPVSEGSQMVTKKTLRRVDVITCLRDNFQFVHEADSGHV